MSNTKYFIREGQGLWIAAKATTLSDAKREATRAQTFQGTDVAVGEEINGSVFLVAQKLHRDALNMSAVGKWQDARPY